MKIWKAGERPPKRPENEIRIEGGVDAAAPVIVGILFVVVFGLKACIASMEAGRI